MQLTVGKAAEEALEGPPRHAGAGELAVKLLEDRSELVVKDAARHLLRAALEAEPDKAVNRGHTLVCKFASRPDAADVIVQGLWGEDPLARQPLGSPGPPAVWKPRGFAWAVQCGVGGTMFISVFIAVGDNFSCLPPSPPVVSVLCLLRPGGKEVGLRGALKNSMWIIFSPLRPSPAHVCTVAADVGEAVGGGGV